MSKHIRALLAILGIAALMVSLVVVLPKTSTAANLTGGNYTYLIDGQEVTFTFDPVVRKDGLLLPIELFQKFNIAVDGGATSTITLSKGNVSVGLTLGSATMTIDGVVKTVSTAPLRLNGRVFVPADPLREFGVDYSQDGNYVILRNFTDVMPATQQMSGGDYTILKNSHTISASIKADTGAYVSAELTLLNSDLVNAANLDLSYGIRAELNGLLKTNTLVLVNLTNYSNKAGAMVTSGTLLVDDQRNQYDVESVLDTGSGLLSNKLAPGANRVGVLVFPKIVSKATNLSVYYDNSATVIGAFPLVR